MRFGRAGSVVAALMVAGGLLAACGDSSGPSGTVPDLTGTWTLENLNVVGTNVPGATGTFVFSNGTDISIDLTVPGTGSFAGTGTYTNTKNHIEVNTNNALIGQATGNFTLVESNTVADTMTANLIAQGQQVSVVVSRP